MHSTKRGICGTRKMYFPRVQAECGLPFEGEFKAVVRGVL